MGLQEIVSWYQKKIGTYDKQAWERTIEQRILHGLSNVPRKSTKLKTDLIDVDLVRGSSFPKAKPKHGFATVLRLAVLRFLFLPAYAGWWIQQTSRRAFAVLLVLYLCQLGNVSLYYYLTSHGEEDTLERVSYSEVVLPSVMMLVLSLIHSQIVSTHTDLKRGGAASVHRSRRVRRTKRRVAPSRSTSGNKTFMAMHRASIDRLQPQVNERETTPLDDDGFESLNGNGSSENGDEENRAGRVDNSSTKPGNLAARSALNWQPADLSAVSGADFQEVKTPPRPACLNADDGIYHQVWSKDKHRPSAEIECSLSDSRLTMPSVPMDKIPLLRVPAISDIGTDDEDDERVVLTPGVAGAAPESSYNSSCESETAAASAVDWPGITTNSDDCSYSSDLDRSDDQDTLNDHPFAWEFGLSPTLILTPSCAASDRVSCTMWERRDAKKADLSVLDISSAIIARVETMPNDVDYFYGGFLLSVGLSMVPLLCRLAPTTLEDALAVDVGNVTETVLTDVSASLVSLMHTTLGEPGWERVIIVVALVERFVLDCLFFFLLAVAERTFKQRFLFAKLFSQLTSSRRARKSDLPHFRLNKVRNIKTWLSVRSYLKRRGPQRSVDVIVSAAFIITLLLLSFLSVECLKDSARVHTQYILEALCWCLGLGVFLLRFMTLGTKINRKYRNLSVLITEQINLYLQIEQKPNKKEELMVANSVLKLAADLLKELECPFKISGLSANPYLYTITKVVILSALSGVLSELLGFKLKLHKIKIK